jgi:hypothetical protein
VLFIISKIVGFPFITGTNNERVFFSPLPTPSISKRQPQLSILNANDVDIPCIDGAIDIVYYDGVESGNARVEWFVVIF